MNRGYRSMADSQDVISVIGYRLSVVPIRPIIGLTDNRSTPTLISTTNVPLGSVRFWPDYHLYTLFPQSLQQRQQPVITPSNPPLVIKSPVRPMQQQPIPYCVPISASHHQVTVVWKVDGTKKPNLSKLK